MLIDVHCRVRIQVQLGQYIGAALKQVRTWCVSVHMWRWPEGDE
jgi:hypothetical protein